MIENYFFQDLEIDLRAAHVNAENLKADKKVSSIRLLIGSIKGSRR